MLRLGKWFLILGFLLLWGTLPVMADTAAELFARAEADLKAGKLADAVKAFNEAADAAPDNAEYAARAKQVKKVAALHALLETEDGDGPWTRIARALHLFYRGERINSEAIKIDKQLHKRLNSALSTALLADSLLADGQNAEAVKVIEGLPEKKRDLSLQAVRVIALARNGQKKEAAEALDTLTPPKEVCSGKYFILARANGAVGKNDEAAKLLTAAFAATPESKLANFQKAAKNSPDFATLVSDSKYASVWTTKTDPSLKHDHKHAENDGRSHCATCPSLDQVQDIQVDGKKSCPTDGAKAAEKAE